MPPPPSATYQRLRQYIAERMRMSHIYQPLMLMELLGRRSPPDPGNRMVGGEEVHETPATLKSSGYRPCRHGAW